MLPNLFYKLQLSKQEKNQITEIRNESGNVTFDFTKIKVLRESI